MRGRRRRRGRRAGWAARGEPEARAGRTSRAAAAAAGHGHGLLARDRGGWTEVELSGGRR